MNTPTYNPLRSLIFLTNRVGRLFAQSVWGKINPGDLEIQPQHMGVLSNLWQKDGVRQQDLAFALIKDKATITRTINFLEQKNILVRIADREDKRIKRIYLTHKGKSLKQKLMPFAEATIKDATEGISEEELNICKKVLGQIYLNLNSCTSNH